MAKELKYERLRELRWRRKLTATEEVELRAWLSEHPGQPDEPGLEEMLTESLGRLPDVPVASNFTARVLAEVERDQTAEARAKQPGRKSWHWRLRWVPRVACVALALGIGLFSYREHQARERQQLVRSLEVVSSVGSLPSPEVLENFEAIRAMNPTPAPAPDEELLTLLQ